MLDGRNGKLNLHTYMSVIGYCLLLVVILLNLSDEVMIDMAKEKDASALWAKLEALYLIKDLNNCLYMLKMMFLFCRVECT